MESLSRSRHPNRSTKACGNAAAAAAAAAGPRSMYDDVYGGPPKFSAVAARTTNRLSPRVEDYDEIFGGFQASRTSSIPVLDLPAVDESEVFFDARRSSGFDYAEIFGGSRGFDFAVSYEDLINGSYSDEAWSEESDISGKNYLNGGSNHQLNADTEFSVSYHQARKMSSEDVTNNGATCGPQFHSVHGYSFMVDSPLEPSEDSLTADNYLDMDFGTETKKSKQVKEAKSSSSNGAISGNGRNGSHGNSFLDISEINLRTQPLDLPPPARPPPAVGSKKANSDQLVSKNASLNFERIAGDSSPMLFGVDLDATSSAAVSAAAIKEAVEQAQARLRSAKELMEKKKEGLQRGRKTGSKKFTKERAGETVTESPERDGVRTELVEKEEKRKASKPVFEIPEVFHGQERPISHEKHEVEENKHKSGSCMIDEINEWKEATEFFEIVTTDELKKDFEHREKIVLQNLQSNGHEHEANGTTEISQKQLKKIKADDHVVEEFEEKKKVKEVPKHKKELCINLEEESEIQDCGKTAGATRTEQLLEPNEKIAEADNNRTENMEPTVIACNNDKSREDIVTPQETRACEMAETAVSEKDSGLTGKNNKIVDKTFVEPTVSGHDFTDEALESLPSDVSAKNSYSEINAVQDVTEESGVFEIENLLAGEKWTAFGKLPDNLGATQSVHLDNQVERTEEIGSITGEPNSEQVTSSSPKLPESQNPERGLTQEYRKREEDRIQPQVSVNMETKMQTHSVRESAESKRKMDEKQKNQKPVQQVNANHSTDIKEKTHEEVDTERGKREEDRENEKARLRKVGEEKEREKEREVQQTNQKSAQELKGSQTTLGKEKTSCEVANKEKQKNQKSPLPVETERKQSKTVERKEKTPREVEIERKENERLRRIEEEKEREREREKDRMAVDLTTLERESRERAERVAVERATAEARQRAMADARERLEKACAEAREKSFVGKTAESRVRAERAAVERATAEARERAAGRAMAERASFEAKDRVQRSVSDKFSVPSGNGRLRQSSSSSDLQSQSSGPSRFQNSSVYSERYEGVEGESAQRCKARLERHRRTTERAAKALAEKNMRDLLAQREQTERNRVAETLDADVRRWSSGKEGNLRALLSTLQYILGPDSGWQPIPLTEVITSAAVKKAYRKATLCVHPDKLQQRGANIQQKYLCEKVFDLLKEGWNKFNSEER